MAGRRRAELAADVAAQRSGADVGRLSLLVLGLLTALGPLSLDMYLPGLPALTRDLDASAAAGQLTLSGCLVGLALGQIVAGPVSDAHGRRTPLLIGLTGYVAASAACGLAPSITTLILLRVAEGALGGAGLVIARAIVRDLYSGTSAARVFSVLMVIMGTAPVLAPLLGGALLHVTSWRGVFLALGTVGAALLAAATLVVKETLPPERRHTGGLPTTLRTFGGLLRDRTFLPHAIAFALGISAMFAYIAASSFVLEDLYGISPLAFSAVFAVNSMAIIVAAQYGGHVVTRVGPARLMRVGLVVASIASLGILAVAIADGPLFALLAPMFVLLASMGLVIPNGTALALAHQGHAAGSASALLGLGQFLLGAAVVPLVGVAGNQTAVPMGVTIAVCALGALVVHEKARRHP